MARRFFPWGAGCHGACSGLLRLKEEVSVSMLKAEDHGRKRRGPPLVLLRAGV